jgi:beta-D-galactosyl-(1->4)-L-rhamnose phosphorylase
MAHVLGVDEDEGARICHGKWSYELDTIDSLLPENSLVKGRDKIYLTDGKAKVLSSQNGVPSIAVNEFGKGKGIYLSEYRTSLENTRLLLNLILFAGDEELNGLYLTDNPNTECAYYPDSQTLIILNNSSSKQMTSVKTEKGMKTVELEAYDMEILVI